MFFGALVTYFVFAMAVIPSLKHRWPALEIMATVSFGVDVLIIETTRGDHATAPDFTRAARRLLPG